MHRPIDMARASALSIVALALMLAPVCAPQTPSTPVVSEAALRANASVYPIPEYPAAAVQAKHAGRVSVEVVIAPITKTSPLARVRSSKVLDTPYPELAATVAKILPEIRYMPFFDDQDRAIEVSSRIVWDFRIKDGKPVVIDPHAPPQRSSDATADDLKIVRRAREILSSENAWNRADNRQCPPHAKTVSVYCALERATLDVTGGFDHRGNAMEDVRLVIEQIAPKRDYDHRLMGYNNDPSTTFADIQRVLQLTEERVSARLKPQ